MPIPYHTIPYHTVPYHTIPDASAYCINISTKLGNENSTAQHTRSKSRSCVLSRAVCCGVFPSTATNRLCFQEHHREQIRLHVANSVGGGLLAL